MNKKTLTTSNPLVKDIIFIHGITSFGASHIDICKTLTKLGYNFHFFDLPGHGAKRKEWETHKFTFNDMLKFVDSYIDTNIKKRPFIIMGHSMGGGITLATYTKYKSQIKAVILECPLTPAVYNHTEDKGKINFVDVKVNLAKYRRMLKDNWRKLRANMFKWLSKDRCFAPLLINIGQSDALDKISKGVASIDVPTLLIVGEKDKVVPPLATSTYLQDHISILTTQVAIGSGHNPFKDTPQQYKEFVKSFLTKINSQN